MAEAAAAAVVPLHVETRNKKPIESRRSSIRFITLSCDLDHSDNDKPKDGPSLYMDGPSLINRPPSRERKKGTLFRDTVNLCRTTLSNNKKKR